MNRRTLLAAAALPIAAPALAQPAWPDRPIRVVVPFAAGGPSDIVVRLLAPKVERHARPAGGGGQPRGAGGVTGVDAVAKAAPDGYTIGIGSAGGLAISPRLDRGTPYDPLRDLAPLTLAVLVPEPLVVPAATPFRTVAELVAAAKAQPGRLNYGSAGSGSMPHLAGELFRMAAGIEITHVSYRGGAPLALAILQNEVQLGFADLPILLPHIRAGGLRALAVGTQQRLEWIPDVPTMAEVGLPVGRCQQLARLRRPRAGAGADPGAAAWRDWPARWPTPRSAARCTTRARSRAAIRQAEFGAFLRAENDKWGGVIQRAGVRAD